MSEVPIPTMAEALRLLDQRTISVPELVEDCLTRIALFEPAVHAFVALTADTARAEARTAQAARDAGTATGALHGLPVGLKDIYETAGIATTAHSATRTRKVIAAEEVMRSGSSLRWARVAASQVRNA